MRTQKCSSCLRPADLSGDAGSWICRTCNKTNMVMRMKPEDAVGDEAMTKFECSIKCGYSRRANPGGIVPVTCPLCREGELIQVSILNRNSEDAVGDTLKARDKTHGDYKMQAYLSQILKIDYRNAKNWRELTANQKESLDMIAVKISRILNGDPNETDHWHDIAGYAKLVEDALKGGEKCEERKLKN